MMNKSLRDRRRESSASNLKKILWLSAAAGAAQKKAAVSGGYKVDNREASNRVDRSHSVSKSGQFDSYARKLNCT
jgi:hypothetical protein